MAELSISTALIDHMARRAVATRSLWANVVAGVAPWLLISPLRGQWLGKDETALAPAFDLGAGADTHNVEAFTPSGNISNLAVAGPAALPLPAPEGAAFLRLSQGRASALLGREQFELPAQGAPVDNKRFYSETAKVVFPVFAERFTDRDLFYSQVASLYAWIRTIAPFNGDAARDNFALHAYYWASDPTYGQFQTADIVYDCAARPRSAVAWTGNNEMAKAKLQHLMMSGQYGLVLINSKVRGGGGGQPKYNYPAWASTAECPHEHWQAVALHEIGHALGLADEYVDVRLSAEQPLTEPNFETSDDPATSSWHTLFTIKPPSAGSVYSLSDQQRFGQLGARSYPGDDFVGLFQGARYSENYYRPSFNCLMRATDCPRFCSICQKAISDALAI